MTRDKFKARSHAMVGHGGWKCPCCGPSDSGDKARIRRFARRELKEALKNIDPYEDADLHGLVWEGVEEYSCEY